MAGLMYPSGMCTGFPFASSEWIAPVVPESERRGVRIAWGPAQVAEPFSLASAILVITDKTRKRR